MKLLLPQRPRYDSTLVAFTGPHRQKFDAAFSRLVSALNAKYLEDPESPAMIDNIL